MILKTEKRVTLNINKINKKTSNIKEVADLLFKFDIKLNDSRKYNNTCIINTTNNNNIFQILNDLVESDIDVKLNDKITLDTTYEIHEEFIKNYGKNNLSITFDILVNKFYNIENILNELKINNVNKINYIDIEIYNEYIIKKYDTQALYVICSILNFVINENKSMHLFFKILILNAEKDYKQKNCIEILKWQATSISELSILSILFEKIFFISYKNHRISNKEKYFLNLLKKENKILKNTYNKNKNIYIEKEIYSKINKQIGSPEKIIDFHTIFTKIIKDIIS
jgi:hypothetical protein